MKAFVLTANGPQIARHDEPRPGANEVLIRVRACGLNRVDLAMMRGAMHGSSGGVGAVLGVECAGDVVAIGSDVRELKIGDRVMSGGGGAFAECRVADSQCVLPIPDGMSYEQAATLPIALQTMHDAVVTNGRIKPGEAVLIQGASSGVGLMAMQIAKHMGARWVAGSSTNASRRQRLREFGADAAIDSLSAEWVDQVLAATDGQGVDLIVDQVAGPTFNQSMHAARIRGRIVNVGRLAGMHGDFDFDLHALRRLTYVGVTFRTRTLEEVREVVRRVREDLWEALVAGRLRLPIDSKFAFDDAAAALDHMAANRHFGKIVLTI
jgi:NADPH:quinone reductase